jgi:positive regulator of sigma E activity
VRFLSQQTDPTCGKCGSRKVKRTMSLIRLGKTSANTTSVRHVTLALLEG